MPRKPVFAEELRQAACAAASRWPRRWPRTSRRPTDICPDDSESLGAVVGRAGAFWQERGRGNVMEISASLVKELRDKTGVGMMACKSALAETNGDLGEAEKVLRKKGPAAANKAGRATGEGVVSAGVDESGRTAVLVETNCETDFCARSADFQAIVK